MGSGITIAKFGIQSGTDRKLYVDWDPYGALTSGNLASKWSKYQLQWRYQVDSSGYWFIGNTQEVDKKVAYRQATWDVPANATAADVRIRILIDNDHKDFSYYKDWCYSKNVYFTDPPGVPPTPTLTSKGYQLTVELNGLTSALKATHIQYQIYSNDTTLYSTQPTKSFNTTSMYDKQTWTVHSGRNYKIRVRSYNSSTKRYSEWSAFSGDVWTVPNAPAGFDYVYALSETSIYVDWKNTDSTTEYELQYTENSAYFDSSPENVKSIKTDAKVAGHAEITGLESGKKYYIRVRSSNDGGTSSWSPIGSCVIGTKPAPPTTWSSTTTAVQGEPLTLYWIHNSEDGSKITDSQLFIRTKGSSWQTPISVKPTAQAAEDNLTNSYSLNTSSYSEGTVLEWMVRTKGIHASYSNDSEVRTVTIYAKPSIALTVRDNTGSTFNTLTSFPIIVGASTAPETQKPLGYHVSIVSNSSYETTDVTGQPKFVGRGDTIYSQFFNTSSDLLYSINASDIDLQNAASYTLRCSVSMDSGLTAESTFSFQVRWTETTYDMLGGIIDYNPETYTANIKPYCMDESGELIDGLTLSVYRREFDGTFTEIGTGIPNTRSYFVVDPHPALDYARYRVVAIEDATGAVSFEDLPGEEIGEKAIIIQWDEEWSSFDLDDNNFPVEPAWTGSLLKLPYNIDISDSNNPDVSVIEYQGRKHPVSYYGTHTGQTATWKVDIPKKDKETLYALRRLSIYMGDVYVREPSGSGYWANLKVSFDQTHNNLVIPVTFNITRVEGGM